MKPFEKRMFWLTLIGIAVGIITAVLFYAQLNEMRNQTGLIVRQSETENAGASHRAAETFRQVNIAQEQANAALLQARTAENAITLSQKEFALAQRPWIQVDTAIPIYQGTVWVGIDSNGNHIYKQPSELMKFPNQLILGNFLLTFTVNFKNVGNSPGLNESSSAEMQLIDLPNAIAVGYTNVAMPVVKDCAPERIIPQTKFVVFPEIPYSHQYSGLPSEEDIDAWVHLKKMLVTAGCIRYNDEFGKVHQTDFCAILDRTEQPIQWRSCPTGNRAW